MRKIRSVSWHLFSFHLIYGSQIRYQRSGARKSHQRCGRVDGYWEYRQMPPLRGLGLGWIIFLHRCRPAGATEGWASQCYTDAAPLGLGFGVDHFSTQMPPRWGYGGVGIAMLHRCRPTGAWVWGVPLFYTDAAPLGLNGSGHRDATQMPPRWG